METREREQTRDGKGPVVAQVPEPHVAQPRKRWFILAVGIIALILLLAFGIPWLRYFLSHEGTDDAYVDADIVQVTSKIDERINGILVNTNQYVHRGQLLIVLDDRDEIVKLEQARAQYDLALANQRTSVEQQQGGVATASGQVGQAQAQLGVALANIPGAEQSYDKAQSDLRRTESLVATGDLPAAQLDDARAEEAAADSQLNAAERQVAAAQGALSAAHGGVTTASGKLAQAADPSQVEAAGAQFDLSRRNLRYTHIYAPIDAYVGEKRVEIGQVISAGMELMTLIPAHGIYITANYKETQMGHMKVGQSVDIRVDAYHGVTFHGHVVSINPASQNTYALVPSQNATGNFVKVTQRIPVRISIDDPRADMPLRPGMSVETYVKVQ